jgi:hypothetical protein
LQAWVASHVAALHAPPAGHEVMVTNGNNQTIEVRIVCVCVGEGGVWVCVRGLAEG